MVYNVLLYRAARRGASPKAGGAKFILTALIFVLSINILSIAPAVSHAQEIYYDGKNQALLNTVPDWAEKGWTNSLFPKVSATEPSSGNNISIDYAPMPGMKTINSVFGGMSESANVTDNTVIVINGKISGQLRGGYTETGDALRNTLVIHAGTYNNVIHGGYSEKGNTAYNIVTIRGGTFAQNVSGGRNGSGNTAYNTVNILGGTVKGTVYGGQVLDSGSAANNTVNISGGVITKGSPYAGDVYGGRAGAGNVTNNTVIISSGDISDKVYGGRTENGSAAGNSVKIASGDIGGTVFGGQADKSSATGNTVAISAGTYKNFIYGGYSVSGNTTHNIVTIRGGTFAQNVSGGRNGSGNAAYNTVNILGGTVKGTVYGGQVLDSGSVANNTVNISGGVITDGTYAGDVFGGKAAYIGDATGNTANVSGGEIGRHVYGGYSRYGDATGNTVTVSGGRIAGNIYGGYSETKDVANNNTVNINGAPILKNAYIYGGAGDNGSVAVWAGNTLNFKNSQTIEAAGVGNFEYYNFWLPAGTANLAKMLDVAAQADVEKARVEVLLNGESLLSAGDKIALITSDSAITGTTANDKSQSMLGTTVLYEFDIYAKDNVLWAELPAPGHAAPESGALTDSHLASAALLTQAADMAAALEYMEVSRDKTDSRYVTFAAVNGGSSAYDIGTDSEFDIDSFLLIAGVMWDVPVRENSLLLRAFAEAGWGGYDTRGGYGGSLVRGSGDSNYYGAGLHARYQWTDDNKPGGFYADASLRAGRIEADFATADMKNSMGTHARYDTSSAYHSAHAGLGHIWRINDKTSLDVSTKYLWTRLRGDTFTMATGDSIDFDSVSSSRWRTGFRAVHDRTEDVSFFLGAYYEYEFDGKANGRAYGIYDIEKASMSGGTGIGELGVIFRPLSNDRFSALLSVQGYVGTREGFSGRLKLQYNI